MKFLFVLFLFSVCISACLSVYMPAWLFVCLVVCLFVFLYAFFSMPAWLFVFLVVCCLLSCMHSSNCLLGCLFSWLFAFLVVCLFVCLFSQPSYKNLILTTFILKFTITSICYFLNDPCCSHTTLYDKHNTHIQLTV